MPTRDFVRGRPFVAAGGTAPMADVVASVATISAVPRIELDGESQLRLQSSRG